MAELNSAVEELADIARELAVIAVQAMNEYGKSREELDDLAANMNAVLRRSYEKFCLEDCHSFNQMCSLIKELDQVIESYRADRRPICDPPYPMLAYERTEGLLGRVSMIETKIRAV